MKRDWNIQFSFIHIASNHNNSCVLYCKVKTFYPNTLNIYIMTQPVWNFQVQYIIINEGNW